MSELLDRDLPTVKDYSGRDVPIHVEYDMVRFLDQIVGSEIRPPTNDELVGYALKPSGECDCKFRAVDRGYMYDFKYCPECGKGWGAC